MMNIYPLYNWKTKGNSIQTSHVGAVTGAQGSRETNKVREIAQGMSNESVGGRRRDVFLEIITKKSKRHKSLLLVIQEM